MFLIVSYDIRDDRRRVKIAKKMLDYGTRVQFSVFECNLNSAQLTGMQKNLASLIKPEEDTIRIYQLCETCRKKVAILGTGELTTEIELYII